MDQRAKKLEKKRKGRERAKKKAGALAARKPDGLTLLVRAAARSELGPCYVSATWDDLGSPALVTVIVTRQLPNGQVLLGTALVDRTCLGVKNAFVAEPILTREVPGIVERFGQQHGGMLACEPLVAQSIVFHAVDYARALGFEPHRDFQEALFGPRPAALLDTPWSAAERPIYLPGPRDNETAITSRLAKAVGDDGFDRLDPVAWDDEEDDDTGDDEDDMPNVHSELERSVTFGATTLRIFIYRGEREVGWVLELEDQLGHSTVWDDRFPTDRAALDTALQAIEEDGVESFVGPARAP